jgi:hypothetical protein
VEQSDRQEKRSILVQGNTCIFTWHRSLIYLYTFYIYVIYFRSLKTFSLSPSKSYIDPSPSKVPIFKPHRPLHSFVFATTMIYIDF